MEKTFAVSKYLSAVKKLVNAQIPPVWVNGVITQISERGRMVYLSLAEFQEGDVRPIAKMDLYLFTREYAQMLSRLAELPAPFTLKEQLKVNLLVEADFYVGSGKFQCHVRNIDPNFTVGELERTRKAILQRLEKEGLLFKNKSLPLAALPLKVGLVTGEATAAYKDFTTTLARSGYAFEVVVESAKMQGNETEATVMAALEKLRNVPGLDAVCIVRGGGSKTDLNYFDSEALCRAVALFPVPVISGIGHQIDESLVDKVAFKSCITPTDTAKFLVSRCDEAKRALKEVLLQIASAARGNLSRTKDRMHAAELKVSSAYGKRIAAEREKLSAVAHQISVAPARLFAHEREKLRRNADGLALGSQKIIDLQRARFQLVEAKVQANDPKRILSKGYTYTTRNGKGLVKNASDVSPGEELRLHFSDGSVSVVAK